MPDPGGGPGRDPPDDTGPSEEEVEDLTGGPGPGEDATGFSQRVIDRFRAIGRAEEKLKVLKAEQKTFKTKYFQAWSKNRTAMKPELQELEEKVKRQTLLLEKLKDRSGACKEKFENERRFASQSSGSSMDHQAMDDPGPSASAPLPPCQAWESPAATSQGVESQHGALTFIRQMESPLRAAVDGVPAVKQKELCKHLPAADMEGKPLTEESPNHHSNVDGFATFTPDIGFAETCSPTSKMAASSIECIPSAPELIDAGGGGDQSHAASAVEADMQVLSVSKVSSSFPSDESRVLVQEKSLPGGDMSVAVSTDTAVITAGTMHGTHNNDSSNADKAMGVLVVGGGNESVNAENDISLPAQQRKDSSVAQTNLQSVQSLSQKRTNVFSAGRAVSYASVLGSRTKVGGGDSVNISGHNLGRFGGGMISGYRRRNVVQLRWEGEGTPPVRGRVAELILEMGFQASDIFALICPVGSYDYDLSFVKPEGLDLFWERYRGCRGLQQWSGLVPKVITRQPLTKLVTILVRNESIPEADLTVWLRRYGEVLTPLRKTLDEHGIWTGAWTVSLKLGVLGNVVQHLPCSAFLGRDRLTIFYQGQPKVCNKCGDKGHFASSCTRKKCSLCQDFGHLARECTQIRCNLCQQLGHPYSQCPEALHNLPGLETELRRLDEEDKAAEAMEESVGAPLVSESDSVSPSDVIPVSVPPVVVPTPNVRRSSRLAEAAGGAGLADLPSRPTPPPVPVPQQRKRGQGSAGVLDGGGVDGVEGGVSISHVSPSGGDSDGEGWEMFRKKKKKKRKTAKAVISSSELDPGGVPVGNTFSVLSGDEISDLSDSLSSMDEGESRSVKRAVSGDEGVVEVKKRLPQSS